MLRELRIRDFAIIEELSLQFAGGLNVLTGETGAGKSILMQAIGLLCGGRASPEVIRREVEEATIEGLFDLGDEERRALEEAGLPSSDELLVRRLISRAGRSRVYLNGELANVALLDRVGGSLIHVYGQLEHALLLRPESHMTLLDTYGGHAPAAALMAERFAILSRKLQQLESVRTGADAARQRAELVRYQLQELEAARLEAGEEEELRREREVLVHAEKLLQICRQGEEALYSGDGSVCGTLGRMSGEIRDAARIEPVFSELTELLDSAESQLQEVAQRLRTYAERQSFDPERREQIEERLAVLQRLWRKYGGSIGSALETRDALAAEAARIESGDQDAGVLENEIQVEAAAAWTAAADLSRSRRAAARRLQREMKSELRALGMQGAGFSVVFSSPEVEGRFDAGDPLHAGGLRLGGAGADSLEFHLAANPGEEAKPLARVASGGELSRIMLALKVLTAGRGEVPTLIFDEVDAGIGGTVAYAVGERLQALGETRQVLCITHLPQIAALADHHFVVEKHVERGRTVSATRPLDRDERVAELSRMLGGRGEAQATEFARRLAAPRSRDSRRKSSPFP